MTAELTAAWTARFGEEISTEETTGGLAVGVPPELWLDALAFARDDLGCGFFDWLTGVDELEDGFAVVVHVYSIERRHHLLVRTRVPRSRPVLPTATGVYRGAAWHERETSEMFGVLFEGHPNLVPLLLPDGFEGHPLRKDFVLAARVAKPWPGAKEPGESGHGAPSRRRVRPPGVPEDGPWAAVAERPRAEDRPRRARPAAEAPEGPRGSGGRSPEGPRGPAPEGKGPDA
ncbi:NADH-quinone oxidoreductase subunit C [Spirillospora albida]|uniref:NADH-quinone oxidoreductase subunit C n=1 Tax=Spirillospora albida TaxID=58123 RepID=UPI00068DC794|nr:NADH-quinone oxidoreductase subunit C [Spirillospora albida]